MSNVRTMSRDQIISMAKTFREFIELYAKDFVDDDIALTIPQAYPKWSGAGIAYKTGDRIRYDGELYKVLSDHVSQGTWTPADAPSLFAMVLVVDEDEPSEWRQPDSTNPYMAGDIVIFDGKQYMSLMDNNVWSPADYPAGWQAVV